MIRGLAHLIFKKYLAKEYLFTHLSAQFSDSLTPQTSQQLNDFGKYLLKLRVKDDTLKDWKNLLEALKEMILLPENINAMLARVQSPLIEVVQGGIDQLPFGKLSKDELSRVLPPSVLVYHLQHCIFSSIFIA
jgi:hypothetical protein